MAPKRVKAKASPTAKGAAEGASREAKAEAAATILLENEAAKASAKKPRGRPGEEKAAVVKILREQFWMLGDDEKYVNKVNNETLEDGALHRSREMV